MKNLSESEIKIKNLTFEDWNLIKETISESYKNSALSILDDKYIDKLIALFPEGQICIEVNNVPVAVAFGIKGNYTDFIESHTYQDIINLLDNKKFKCEGNTYYGLEIFVHPDYRGFRLGGRLYDAGKALCERLNLKSIIMVGRIPDYHQYIDKLTAVAYVEKVKSREINDSILSFQISNGFYVKNILKEYLPGKNDSKTCGVLLEWANIYFEPKSSPLSTRRSVVRVGIVQWQMRKVESVDEIIDLVEFFVDAVSGYHANFLLFPELFTAPLMAKHNSLETPDAIRELAKYTVEILEKMQEFAVTYNINIISGSMPLIENDQVYNVAHLHRRDGTFEQQKKIHITPSEIEFWGIKGGDSINVFDTDSGKIAINICYDVEFPELARFCADKNIDILMVPFLTDTQNGYHRVRRCAQARAIENECFVAISGCVGNLPKVRNMDIQYAQSAVFSPSDFSFPVDAIVSEATPNTEMTVIADVDLDSLKELRSHGSVRNLNDRRKDLYEIVWKK